MLDNFLECVLWGIRELFTWAVTACLFMGLLWLQGSLFDWFMGTRTLPIWVVGVPLMWFSPQLGVLDRSAPFQERMVRGAKSFGLLWGIVLMAAMVGTLVFPALSIEFLKIVSYEGNLISFAFWSSLVGGGVTFLLFLIMEIFHEPEVQAWWKQQ